MAKAVGLGVATVQRIWAAHGLWPHRWRIFKLSEEPAFVEKLHDIVGLYVSPPAHAVALGFDDKSQIQALDRTQPGSPMDKGSSATMTHDDKRHRTTTLFAELNALVGEVIGWNMQRHRHQGFLHVINVINRDTAAGMDIHVILDNYATTRHLNISWRKRRCSLLAKPL